MYGSAIGDAAAKAFIASVLIAFALGALVTWGLPKLWSYIKPLLYSLTA